MSLHLQSVATDKIETSADKAYGRVRVYFGGYSALLTLSVEEARALANGLQNACVELEMPVEEAA